MKMKIASPSVAPHVRQAVRAYEEAGWLRFFYTTFVAHKDQAMAKLWRRLPPLGREVSRRAFDDVPLPKVKTRPVPELLRTLSARKLGPVTTDRVWEWAELGFDRWVASQLSAADQGVHTYEHAALFTLQKAKKLGLLTVYEQSSVHHTFYKTMIQEQLKRYPALLSPELVLKTNALADRRNARRDGELTLADLIICNSSFTCRTLTGAGIAPEKIVTLPLAFPPVADRPPRPARPASPMVFLHAGNQSVTKGTHILYEAWRQSNFSATEAELWLIGRQALPEALRQSLPGKVIYRQNIPHTELMARYREADVLLMPSLSDGFGMVITEAMSQGVPVIASANCCGPDLISSGTEGWIVPAGDAEALSQQLRWCAANRAAVAAAGEAANAKAAGWQWPEFRAALIKTISERWPTTR